MSVPECPTDTVGQWQYMMETQRLLDENKRIINSMWPWNLWRAGRQLKVIGQRTDALFASLTAGRPNED